VEWTEEQRLRVNDWLRAGSWPLVDLEPVLSGTRRGVLAPRFNFDGLHPTLAGHTAIADAVLRVLVNIGVPAYT
jgi:lysophospholipase L1-like esterase